MADAIKRVEARIADKEAGRTFIVISGNRKENLRG
jgi:hypothetical protein